MKKILLALWLCTLCETSFTQVVAPGSDRRGETSPVAIETLHLSTRLVAISAVVKSKEGTPVEGLTREDFLLKQDGREQPVRYLTQASDLPLTLALLVDTSGSQRNFIREESLASDAFVQTMIARKQDRAMIVQFDTKVLQLKSMTNSTQELHLALGRLSPKASDLPGTLLREAVFVVAKNILATETGRKAIVILSDGQDLGSHHSLDEVMEQAQRGNIQIYSILYSEWVPDDLDLRSGLGHLDLGGDPGMKVLRKLSETTGGRLFIVSHNMSLGTIYAQIANDLHVQYELGYTPPSDIKPNSFHKLQIKMKNNRLTVQARQGFYAAP